MQGCRASQQSDRIYHAVLGRFKGPNGTGARGCRKTSDSRHHRPPSIKVAEVPQAPVPPTKTARPVPALSAYLPNPDVSLVPAKLVMAAARTWHRLKGEKQLPKVVQGVTFTDGVEVSDTPAQHAA